MSFLNSVLSSINTGGSQLPSAPATPTIPSKPSLPTNESSASASISLSDRPRPAPNLKRKATDASLREQEKKAKRNADGTVEAINAQKALNLSRPHLTPQTVKPRSTTATTLLKPRVVEASTPTPPSSTSTIPKNPPKKGSFAEIMARQNAAKSAAPAGVIQNKPRERISEKKKLQLMKKGLWDADKNVPKRLEKAGHSRSSSENKTFTDKNSSKVKSKKTVETAYKGTATSAAPPKPKPQPSYRGTMTMAPKHLPAREKAKVKPKPSRDRYLDTDEEEDGDDIDDEEEAISEGGYSDESEEMEAGFDDVEDEEEEAARQAKKDDATEAAFEAKLKREKEERRKKLQQLAKSAKPRSY